MTPAELRAQAVYLLHVAERLLRGGRCPDDALDVGLIRSRIKARDAAPQKAAE